MIPPQARGSRLGPPAPPPSQPLRLGPPLGILAVMYESLRGRLLSKDATSCVVEAGGLGYALHVPFSTAERLPAAGAEVAMKLHLVVREDEWRLFGFLSVEERALFRSCLSVSGVGPSTALALLSGMRAADLRNAVAAGDVAALTRIKGIGKKTAERIVVELRDKLAAEGGAVGGGVAPPAGPVAQAIAALTALGLDPGEAAERLRRIPKAAELDTGELVKRALRGVGK